MGNHAGHSSSGDHSHGPQFLGRHSELILAITCGVCLVIAWIGETGGWLVDPALRVWYVLAMLSGGFYATWESLSQLRRGRFEIDFLMIVAALGAASLGAWGEGSLLLFLFSLGHALEHFALGRARHAIEALAELTPETAWVQRDGREQQLPIAELRVGDICLVKPNERLAADGFVIEGESSINQAPITGESVPVDKRPVPDRGAASARPDRIGSDHRVFAGTINGNGALQIQVTRIAGDSTLARVVQMVNEAEAQKSPTQMFADRFEAYFVPAVLLLVLGLLFMFLVRDESFGESFYRAMAVLVAASPCALAISTPSAVLSGVARAARGGLLIKGGGPLETLGRLRAMAFDKTGTITAGRPRITDVCPADNVSEQTLLRVAIAVESLSDHPLAAAVVRDARARLSDSMPIPRAQGLNSLTGQGVHAEVDGQTVTIGKVQMFLEEEERPVPLGLLESVERLIDAGRTTMLIRQGDQFLGVIGMLDTPRPEAAATLDRLRTMGIERMVMISGDHQQVADAVARSVGLDEAKGGLMPAEKVVVIREMQDLGEVAMVGDGVNDAPALATATVGIAMGAAGSDVALETADVALMGDDLGRLPFAVGLSRKTNRIIRQNLWISLGMVAVLVPCTLFGLRLGWAVLFHEGSTIVVVFNALRLLVYREPG